MTAAIVNAVGAARTALVADQRYRDVLIGLIDHASARLLCSVFIVDITPTAPTRAAVRGDELAIDDVLQRMAAAAWRGADVRLLIGGSRDNIALAEAAAAARTRAMALGLPCRWLTSHAVRGSHCKMVIADDNVLSGSHNWSSGALIGTRQTQDSVLVASRDLAAVLAARFETQWSTAEVPHAAL